MGDDLETDNLDLVIRASRLVCAATGLDGPGVIGVRDGLIAFVEPGLVDGELPAARETLVVDDGVLLPGWVDLHAHPALSGSRGGSRSSTASSSRRDSRCRKVARINS